MVDTQAGAGYGKLCPRGLGASSVCKEGQQWRRKEVEEAGLVLGSQQHTKVCLVKAMGFYSCDVWNKAKHQRTDTYKLVLEKTRESLGQQGDQASPF